MTRVGALGIALVLAACGGGDDDGGSGRDGGAGADDAGAGMDAGLADSGSGADTGAPRDGGAADTGAADGGTIADGGTVADGGTATDAAGRDASIDAGPALADCAGRPHGTTETRECFDAARPPAGGTCASTTQSRTCDDGTWSPDWPACDFFTCGPGAALYLERVGTTSLEERTYAGAVDSAGYAYVVAGRIAGGRGVYVRAFASDGTRRWTRMAGGATARDEALDVATDGTGNVFIAGYANSSTINLGGSDLMRTAPDTGVSVIVASYTRDDVHRWSLRVPGSGTAAAIAVGPTGRVYVGGQAFGEIALEGTRVPVAATGAGFVARYDGLGMVEWSRIIGDQVVGVGGDAAGNVFVAGAFTGTVDFGGGMTRTGPAQFVASYTSTGTLRWVRDIPGNVLVTSLGVAPGSGAVAIGGRFVGTVDFGAGPVTASTGGSDTDPFVVAYANDGTVSFVKNIDAGGPSRTNDVAWDASGNLYAAGEMQGGFDFATEARYSLSGRINMFFVSYDPTGAHRWSEIAGGALQEERAFGVGAGDYVIVTGQVQSTFGAAGMGSGGWAEDGIVLALVR